MSDSANAFEVLVRVEKCCRGNKTRWLNRVEIEIDEDLSLVLTISPHSRCSVCPNVYRVNVREPRFCSNIEPEQGCKGAS